MDKLYEQYVREIRSIVIILISIAIIGLTVILVLNFIYRDLPQMSFPLDNRNATYVIRKHQTGYAVDYIPLKGKQSGYYYVGNSKVDLEPAVDKKVRVKGSFRARSKVTNEQCIVDVCTPLYYAILVDIDALFIEP